MRINEILKKDGQLLRILAIRDKRCFCINCCATQMPVWIPADELKGCVQESLLVVNDDLTSKQKQVAHKRYTLIAPVLAFLTDDVERNRIINLTCQQHCVSRQTLK